MGKRDSVRVGDIVGAVANEAGIPGERIGTVELFESHSIVELAADDAAKAVEVLGDATLRGRSLRARIDERGGERAPRKERTFGPPRADRGERGAPRGPARSFDRGDRGDRPARPFDRADRAERSDRPARSFDRSDRPPDRAPRDSARSDDRGPRSGPPRGGVGGGAGRGPVRPDEARRAFGDRPVRERAEGKQEWSERGARMQNAKRPPRPSEGSSETDRDSES